MSTLPDKRTNAADTITTAGLFLFSVGIFNLPGQIFFALTVYFFVRKSKIIVVEKHDMILLLFQQRILLSILSTSALQGRA